MWPAGGGDEAERSCSGSRADELQARGVAAGWMDLAGGWLDGENEEGGEGGGGMGIDGWDISLKFRVWSDLVRGCPLYIVGG